MTNFVNIKEQTQLLEVENQIEFNQKNYVSIFFFTWIYRLLKIGKGKPLVQSDLVNIDQDCNMEVNHQRFVEFQKKQPHLLLWQQLFMSFRCLIIFCAILYLIIAVLQTCSPLITKHAEQFFIYSSPNERPSAGRMFIFVAIQLIYKLTLSLLKPYQNFYCCLLSIKLQGALTQEILIKTLKFPISRSRHFTTGELINMMQVDIHQASNYFYYAIILFTVPLQLLNAFIVVFNTLQSQAIIPAIGSIIEAIIGILFGYLYGIIQKRYMIAKDKRMKSVDEALIHAKQIKLNNFEEFFEERIRNYREKELQQLRLEVMMMIYLPLIQSIIAILTWECVFFLTNPINFSIINLMMSNYASITSILSNLPYQYKSFQVSRNSMARLDNFFSQKECDDINYITEESNTAIRIKSGKYGWKQIDEMNQDVVELDEEREQINNILNEFHISLDIEIKKGQFIAFVGNSASGKSTILRSILGETYKNSGDIIVNGKISVATQEPWIINGSIRKNITFMNSFDSVKYNKVIKVCGLEKDISTFPNGDENILAEKGDNLSGGQQKRINLARSIYNDAEIYLLDDPLSALDIKLKYQIHQQCFQEYLKNKTRILFTNSLSNLQNVDIIYMIENGQIVKSGTFAQITGLNQTVTDQSINQQNYEQPSNSNNQPYFDNQEQSQSLIQKEDQRQGNISLDVYKQVFTYIGKYFAPLCTFIYFVTVLGFQLYGNDKMTENVTDEQYQRIVKIYYPITQLPQSLAVVLINAYYLLMGLSTSRKIHNSIINRLLNASYTKFYNTILIGRLMNRLSKDMYNIDLEFPNEIQNFSIQIINLLIPLVECFIYFNYVALPLLIIFLVGLCYITIIYYRCLREITRIEAVSKSPIFSYFQQIVRGILYVRTCLPIEKVVGQQQINTDKDLGNQINLDGIQYWYQSLAGATTNVFQGLLFVICFFFPGKNEDKTFLVLNKMQELPLLVLNAAISYGNIQMYLISFERCLHLARNVELEYRIFSYQNLLQQGTNITELQQNTVLQMKNCTFQYRPNSRSVLEQLSFSLNKKEKIGVVGRTGSGKSSIILALTAILEQTEGSIELEQQNIEKFSIKQQRDKFSIIPQDPIIFMGTLKENLDPLNKFSLPMISDIAQKCRLLEMQSFQQQGLDSQINLSGSNLSLGEKQLLTIVRCILDKKNIILIDEATSNIDSKTEEHVKELFEKYFSDVSLIAIAQKVTTIMKSDKILVLDTGKVKEFDHPQKLLTNPKSEFRQIIELIKQADEL